MTISDADLFMNCNKQFDYEFGFTETVIGLEPSYTYYNPYDGGTKIIVIRDIVDYPEIYSFQTWSNGHEIQMSAIHEGQDALDFITTHEYSFTYAKLHVYRSKNEAEEAYYFIKKN